VVSIKGRFKYSTGTIQERAFIHQNFAQDTCVLAHFALFLFILNFNNIRHYKIGDLYATIFTENKPKDSFICSAPAWILHIFAYRKQPGREKYL